MIGKDTDIPLLGLSAIGRGTNTDTRTDFDTIIPTQVINDAFHQFSNGVNGVGSNYCGTK